VRLQFAPKSDAFEQGARLVEARQPERQRGVHMEMRIYKRGADKPAGSPDFLCGIGNQVTLDGCDPPIVDTDINIGAAVGQIHPAHNQVKRHSNSLAQAARPCFSNWIGRARSNDNHGNTRTLPIQVAEL